MSTIKIKTPNGYEKVEIPSCLPANVEFGEPEDWTSKKDGSYFVSNYDGILTGVFAATGNSWVTIRENNVAVVGKQVSAGGYYSLVAPIRKGETYNISFSGGSATSDSQFTFYPFKTKPVNDYPTDEICIGKWIDGKPLYRKVIDLGSVTSLPSLSWFKVSTFPSNIEQLINTIGVGSMSVPLIGSSDGYVMNLRNDVVSVRYIVIEYTKQ